VNPSPDSKYANVKNAHIVPRMYLANWAVDEKIGVRLVRERRTLIQSIEKVGTRRQYYKRQRPDGTEIHDVEWTLAEIEGTAAPVLNSLEDEWPLDSETKLKLATLLAVQLLRGPRWRGVWEDGTRRFLDEYPDPPDASPEQLEEDEQWLLGDTNRLIHMLSMTPTMATALVSMHWTLLGFPADVIATSDHPVVLWPGLGGRRPEASPLTAGVLECGEIRLPLSPRLALLMTWIDAFDDEGSRVLATRDHARNLNAFTIANADRQWFHLPKTSPPVGSGSFLPLSVELVPGYTAEVAARSERRSMASAAIQPKIGRDLTDQEVTVVRVSRNAPSAQK
jgi:hypothetical protein